MIFVLYFIPVIVWVVYTYITDKEISFIEACGHILATSAAIAVAISLSYFGTLMDKGIVVGQVDEAYHKRYNCYTGWSTSTSYGCRNYDTRTVKVGETCSGTGSSRSCTPNYRTEYRHHYSWEQSYYVTGKYRMASTTLEIDRVDRRGANTPPRYQQVIIGEPFAMEYSYPNYVRAAEHSLLNRDAKIINDVKYPVIFDYYRVNGSIIGYDQYADALQQVARDSGVMVLLVKAPELSDPSYAEDLKKTFHGYKKFDLVIIQGDNWIEVFSWSTDHLVNVKVRDHIRNNDDWIETVASVIKEYYVAPEDKDFEYLWAEVKFPVWGHIILILILVSMPFVTNYLRKNDIRKIGRY